MTGWMRCTAAILPQNPPESETMVVSETLQAAAMGSRWEASSVEVPPHRASGTAARLQAPLPTGRAAHRTGTGL